MKAIHIGSGRIIGILSHFRSFGLFHADETFVSIGGNFCFVDMKQKLAGRLSLHSFIYISRISCKRKLKKLNFFTMFAKV